MSKEIRTLFFQDNEPDCDLKPGDVWLEKDKEMIRFHNVQKWLGGVSITISSVPISLNEVIGLLTNGFPFSNYNYVQHPKNQIGMLDLTTTNN